MPKFETVAVAGTAAEKAVSHILDRVVNDRNFSWYMIGTESFRLCLAAAAEHTGKTEEAFEREIFGRMQRANERLRRHNAEEADVEVQRKRLERIDDLLGRMSDGGLIDDKHYTRLCDFVHRDPSEWPADR
jgi:hypothetical protein